jgi:serine/threonine protein kinase
MNLNNNNSKFATTNATDDMDALALTIQQIENELFEIPKKYVLQEIRGKGSYGVVCAGKNIVTGEPVAVKKNKQVFPVYVSNADDDDEVMMISSQHPHRSKTSQKRILRELRILMHLSHQNIINLKEVIKPKSLASFSDVYFVTDLMEADLRDIIDSDQPLTDEHIQYFMYQILIALNYIHSADILHRDLKPENILLNSNCELKLCDFGLSRGLDFDEDPTMSTAYVQTRWYRAPELLLNNATVTKQVDMWSVGCIFAELLGRKVLFQGSNPVDQLKKIIAIVGTPAAEDIKSGSEQYRQFVIKSVPFSTPKDFKQLFPTSNPLALDLLKKILHFNPEKRYSAEQALKHPYFKSIFDKNHVVKCPTKFDFSFEDEAERKGIKEVCYATIMQFHQRREQENIQKLMQQQMLSKQQPLNPAQHSFQKHSSRIDSPISGLIQNYFANATQMSNQK